MKGWVLLLENIKKVLIWIGVFSIVQFIVCKLYVLPSLQNTYAMLFTACKHLSEIILLDYAVFLFLFIIVYIKRNNIK